jgi:hypothetical protein
VQAALGDFEPSSAKLRCTTTKRPSSAASACPVAIACGSLSNPEQPPLRPELAEDQPAVPATPERAVQIAAIGAYGESLDGFVKQYGDVVKAAIYSHRIKSRSSSGMAPGC